MTLYKKHNDKKCKIYLKLIYFNYQNNHINMYKQIKIESEL
jgi:hypothetical protein